MTVCSNCGAELSHAGQTFCPFCGAAQGSAQAADAPADSTTALERVAASERNRPAAAVATEATSFPSFEKSRDERDHTRRAMFIAVALASAVLVAGLIWLATRPRVQSLEPRLAGAIRPGSAEFAQFSDRLVLEFDADQNALRSERPLGDVVITMQPTVRNFTGRTINGLEIHARALDLAGQPVKERTVILIPDRQPVLEPNKTMTPTLMLEGIKKDNEPASLKMEITGVKFK